MNTKAKLINKLPEYFRKDIHLIYSLFGSLLIIKIDDTVHGFGTNNNGELGIGHNDQVDKPVLIQELSYKNIRKFKNGLSHCIALSDNGLVYSFGSNERNQLGYETDSKHNNKPRLIETLSKEKIIKLCCGAFNNLVLTENGEVFWWGSSDSKNLMILPNEKLMQLIPTKLYFNCTKVKSIKCGLSHLMVLSINGDAYIWGDNTRGQLGIKSNEMDYYSPQKINIGEEKFKGISCGRRHSILLSTKEKIYTCGSNEDMQLGYKAKFNIQSIFVELPDQINCKILKIYGHFNENISACLSDGFIVIWGKINNKRYSIPFKTKYNSFNEFLLENSFKSSTKPLYYIEKKFLYPHVRIQKFKDEYEKIDRVGKGGFANVYKVKKLRTLEVSAIKRIEMNDDEIKKIKRFIEVEVLSKIKSDLIVEYKEAWIEKLGNPLNEKTFLYIEMELCSKNLEELNHQLTIELNYDKSKVESVIGFYIKTEIMKEVVEGLKYLHDKSIIHRDLNPKNILITDKKKNGKHVRISDFGLSCFFSERSKSGNVGTLKYMAPELLTFSLQENGRKHYDEKVDIFSLGITIETIFNPTDRTGINDSSSAIITEKYDTLITIKNKMLNPLSTSRPNAKVILRDSKLWSFENFEQVTQFEELKLFLRQNGDNKSFQKGFIQNFLVD